MFRFDPDLFPLLERESDKCGITAESGEDVAWDEVWESLRA